MITTIQVDNKLKAQLDSLKVHKRESYNDLLVRVLENCSPRKFDQESLIETIEVLSDPETMRNLGKALEDKNNPSSWVSWEQLKKENGLWNNFS